MAKRKSMSLRNRFNVFKRDEFKCKYCGRGVPDVILEVDHIVPVSKGGDNSQNNLITSCFDCNRGKGAESLLTKPENITDTLLAEIELKKEKQKQIKYIDRELQKIKDKEDKILIELGHYFFNNFEYEKDVYVFSGQYKTSVQTFLKKMTPFQIKECMDISFSKNKSEYNTFRYFCGVCWGKIKEKKPSW